jgi:hypothetical protein
MICDFWREQGSFVQNSTVGKPGGFKISATLWQPE